MNRRKVVAGALAALAVSTLPAVAALKVEDDMTISYTSDGVYYDFYYYRGYEMKIAHEEVIRFRFGGAYVKTAFKCAIDAYLDEGKMLKVYHSENANTWYKSTRYYARAEGMQGGHAVLVMEVSRPITNIENITWSHG